MPDAAGALVIGKVSFECTATQYSVLSTRSILMDVLLDRPNSTPFVKNMPGGLLKLSATSISHPELRSYAQLERVCDYILRTLIPDSQSSNVSVFSPVSAGSYEPPSVATH